MPAANSNARRFPIRFGGAYGAMSSLVFIPPSLSYVEVENGEVQVRMAWAFRARIPRTAVISVKKSDCAPLSRGVHGWGGRWLVNGSGDNILALELAPGQKATVMGFPVRLRELLVSVDDPDALLAALV